MDLQSENQWFLTLSDKVADCGGLPLRMSEG